MRLHRYEVVRVTKVRAAPEAYDSWKVNKRIPEVGDMGALVDVLSAPGMPERYVVECVSATGETDWLGDFAENEIEPVK